MTEGMRRRRGWRSAEVDRSSEGDIMCRRQRARENGRLGNDRDRAGVIDRCEKTPFEAFQQARPAHGKSVDNRDGGMHQQDIQPVIEKS